MYFRRFGSRMFCKRIFTGPLLHSLSRVMSSRRGSMQRLRDGRPWSVFDPVDVPLLFEVVGLEFTAAYADYEASGLAIRVYEIADIWDAIVDSQRETGSPFLLFQDNING